MSSGLPGWDAWCDKHGRPKATGGNGGSSATSMFFFIFYVMLEGNPLIVCLPGFSPVFQHQGTEEPTNAAFNCLQSHGLLCRGASFPTSVWELENFFSSQIVQASVWSKLTKRVWWILHYLEGSKRSTLLWTELDIP